VPGDFSSAAFLMVAALLVPGSEVVVEGVGLNPTRTGLLGALERMGADITVRMSETGAQEPQGTITARYCDLSATDVDASEVPNLIDELPAFMLAAARAHGRSSVRGAAELRVKESDRLKSMALFLSSLGVAVSERPDGLDIEGRPGGWTSGEVQTQGDHRLAMVGAIAGCASTEGVLVDDVDCMGVSFPGFVETICGLGGRPPSSSHDSARG
jgi:3-phosphoshikimate 1-carboxyvinyltransferase